ncbi:MAG TPA: ATP-binding protein [Steroidobacteraceae bacterium]|jgi:PAS domain S-box-containing protein|nr:ATP-binding protein [Steroidobacteraceae bacterium]
MIDSFVGGYFSTDGFMPHGMCYLWQPGVLTLHVISDALISLAYFSISCTLLYFVHRRIDLKHKWIFMCFAIFIVACGFTHAMEILTIWHPAYWLSGGIKLITAFASLSTAILLINYFPSALRLPAPSAMHRIVQLETLNRSLAEDSARTAIAADAAGLGFWTFDVATKALHWDESMYRLYGLLASEGEEPGALRESRSHLENHAKSGMGASAGPDGGRDYDAEFRAVYPNGIVRHLKAVAQVTRDADGNAIRMLGVTFDITERKNADEQFRLAIEAAPTGMLLMDREGSIVLVNAQIERLFGYLRAELLGQPMKMLVAERFRAGMRDLRAGLFSAPTALAPELYGLRKDGSEVPIEIGLNPLLTSEGEFVLSSIVDLSQRLEIERIRNEFVSTVSHELRTPLTSIRGSLGLLESGAMGALPDKAAEMVTIAYKNSGRLVRIINDILDISTIEAGKLALQMRIVTLAELLQQSVEANSGFAAKCEVRFVLEQVSANDRVMADPDRLTQVVANLLSNAAKFSHSGSDVLVRVRSGLTTLCIEVQDSGAGIPEEFKAHIFTKFAQADASATRRFEGTGLGLSIARKLTEAMGGSIGFDSVVGQGSVFYIELPRVDTAPAMCRSTRLSETAAHKVLLGLADSNDIGASTVVPRLLYVEDDEDLISVIRAALGGRVEIVPARNLREAEQLLREQEFALVMLDQLLPDGNGISLVDRIAEYPGHPLPIIILSAADVPRDAYPKAAAVLIKSQVSAAQVATTILSYLAARGA